MNEDKQFVDKVLPLIEAPPHGIVKLRARIADAQPAASSTWRDWFGFACAAALIALAVIALLKPQHPDSALTTSAAPSTSSQQLIVASDSEVVVVWTALLPVSDQQEAQTSDVTDVKNVGQ